MNLPPFAKILDQTYVIYYILRVRYESHSLSEKTTSKPNRWMDLNVQYLTLVELYIRILEHTKKCRLRVSMWFLHLYKQVLC